MADTTTIEKIVKQPLLRTLHFYASVVIAALIAFYALTGFIATHQSWFIDYEAVDAPTNIEAMPSSLISEQEPKAVEEWLKQRLSASAERLEIDASAASRRWRFVYAEGNSVKEFHVDRDAATLETINMQQLPQEAPQDAQALAAFMSEFLSGELDAETFFDDTDLQVLHFSLRSVWQDQHVQILKEKRLFQVEQEQHSFVKTLIKLHRGEHAQWWQTLLADIMAVLMLFVVVTGVIIGVAMKRRNRMTYMLTAVSIVLTLALLIAR